MASELSWFPLALLSTAFAVLASVALVAVFAIIFLGEKSTLRGWVAIGLVSAGVVTLALENGSLVMRFSHSPSAISSAGSTTPSSSGGATASSAPMPTSPSPSIRTAASTRPGCFPNRQPWTSASISRT